MRQVCPLMRVFQISRQSILFQMLQTFHPFQTIQRLRQLRCRITLQLRCRGMAGWLVAPAHKQKKEIRSLLVAPTGTVVTMMQPLMILLAKLREAYRRKTGKVLAITRDENAQLQDVIKYLPANGADIDIFGLAFDIFLNRPKGVDDLIHPVKMFLNEVSEVSIPG